MSYTIDSVVNISDTLKIITGVTNIGIICEKKEIPNIYLVDSGGDSDAGKKIYKILEQIYPEGFLLKAIICTHSNADHIGGNAWLQNKTKCEIWSSLGERGSIEQPFLESALIWGGFPFAEITTKYFIAKKSNVTKIINFSEKIQLSDGGEISFISLPGHYFDMIGILYKDPNTSSKVPLKTLFLGDAIFGRHVIKKYWIPFLYDVKSFKSTLNLIKDFSTSKSIDFFIPSHGNILEDAEALTELNLIAIMETEASILEALQKERTMEELLKHIADINEIKLGDGQFVLIGSTLRSYLSYLQNEKKIFHIIKDNKMYWKKV